MSELTLHILSPEGTLVSASVSLVSLPGTLSPFTVLPGHAPIVTSLEKGSIRYVEDGEEKFLQISGGFVRVKDNTVTVCAEV